MLAIDVLRLFRESRTAVPLAGHVYPKNAGISVVADNQGFESSWDGVTIENSTVRKVDRVGIFVGSAWQGATTGNMMITMPMTVNVTIDNNVIDDAGDGILTVMTNNVLIDHNVVSNTGSRIAAGCTDGTFSKDANYCNHGFVARVRDAHVQLR